MSRRSRSLHSSRLRRDPPTLAQLSFGVAGKTACQGMLNVGNKTAHFVRMSNAQLDQLMNALEGTAVPILFVAAIVAGLLSIFLQWFRPALFRDRSALNARQRER